jgi:uncharacterized HAD superfamily protein
VDKISPEHIGFDIDGVVADTGSAFIRIARDEYGLQSISLEDITYYEVVDCLNVEQSIVEAIFTRLHDNPLPSGIMPMEGAFDVLHALAEHGPLTYVTARSLKGPISMWLEHHVEPGPFADMRLEVMGEHDNKAPYIKDLGLRYFVDDRLQTCQNLAREGITPLVYNQPWNMNGHDLQTVDNWQAIYRLCFG